MIPLEVCYDSHTELQPTVYSLLSAVDVFSLTKHKHTHTKREEPRSAAIMHAILIFCVLFVCREISDQEEQ